MRTRLSLQRILSRTYATRRAEKPPMRRPDPLLNSSNAKVETLPNNITFIHRPPPTAPTPFSTTLAPASPLLASTLPSLHNDNDDPLLPPPSRTPRLFPDARTLKESDIAEMRRLRASDPALYTRGKLAKMFNCSAFFVGQLCGLNNQERKKALETREGEHDREREQWGDNKATIMALRKKRRSLW